MTNPSQTAAFASWRIQAALLIVAILSLANGRLWTFVHASLLAPASSGSFLREFTEGPGSGFAMYSYRGYRVHQWRPESDPEREHDRRQRFQAIALPLRLVEPAELGPDLVPLCNEAEDVVNLLLKLKREIIANVEQSRRPEFARQGGYVRVVPVGPAGEPPPPHESATVTVVFLSNK
jgi:hypothetical protein